MAVTRVSRSEKYADTDILIDTGSTCSVFRNNNILINIMRSGTIMRAVTNGGHQDSDHTGLFPGFFEVWLNKESLLNILSMRDVRKHFRMVMDTDVEAALNIYMKNGYILKSTEVELGLYIFCPIIKTKHSSDKISAYSFLTLINGNKSGFTRREVKMANRVRAIYRRIRWPGNRRYLKVIGNISLLIIICLSSCSFLASCSSFSFFH